MRNKTQEWALLFLRALSAAIVQTQTTHFSPQVLQFNRSPQLVCVCVCVYVCVCLQTTKESFFFLPSDHGRLNHLQRHSNTLQDLRVPKKKNKEKRQKRKQGFSQVPNDSNGRGSVRAYTWEIQANGYTTTIPACTALSCFLKKNT